jgi:hypothetical protein
MKINILLAVLALGLGYATCKTIKKPDAAAAEQPKLIIPDEHAGDQDAALNFKAAHVLSSNPDSAPPVQIHRAPARVNVPIAAQPAPTASRKAYLATGWWHCSDAMCGIDSLVGLSYKPKWMKFREDQTFDVLIKGKVVDTGQWAFDEAKNQIFLSCKDTYLNNSWQLQDKGFVMIWKGNTDLNVTGIQIRVICSKTQPVWD